MHVSIHRALRILVCIAVLIVSAHTEAESSRAAFSHELKHLLIIFSTNIFFNIAKLNYYYLEENYTYYQNIV